ncbi:Bug family tripartite tricarboxylate transporter substrate binding protein [Hydrogenophaga laconesensis]|uniref:Tripartite-type tricarboxylate transporter receptor subunit TctC n=1 Tax=Hydrogenophaga laconesensis TaxID=1805971 RepID=A0ABU1V642_9BURK|nr:tripartite tricarboxylate transporter substrate binding protein [Hydrogenophaga laconesensis]MDR7092813.1 tripartite-type tricarboxylate transporter receptor subunit TctC [Hydrogenophaga laconesensis]
MPFVNLSLKAVVAAAALALATAAAAQADVYPNKPVRIIVPFPPGGGIDILIRAVGKELSDKWKQPVVIDNRGGAATFIGAEAVARAAPDGYTLLATTDPTFTANRHLFSKLPYDPDKDFEPVIQMVKGDNIIVAHPSVPVTDLKGLVAAARKKESNFSFGSYGNGTQPHLAFGTLNKREGIEILHVPYKGITPVVTAVLAKEVDVSLASAGVMGEMIRSERVRPLAITGARRMPQFPNVPTTAELGFPYLQSSIWYGVFAPAGTPAGIVNKLNAEIAAILKDASFAERQILSKGMTPLAGSPRDLANAMREDSAAIGEMVKAANIKPE